jgi:hypothetical protein
MATVLFPIVLPPAPRLEPYPPAMLTENLERLKTVLTGSGNRTRINVSDGRVFFGHFMCVDRDRNVVLGGTEEKRGGAFEGLEAGTTCAERGWGRQDSGRGLADPHRSQPSSEMTSFSMMNVLGALESDLAAMDCLSDLFTFSDLPLPITLAYLRLPFIWPVRSKSICWPCHGEGQIRMPSSLHRFLIIAPNLF